MDLFQLHKNVSDILFKDLHADKARKTIVISDTDSPLAVLLFDAYKRALKGYPAEPVEFGSKNEEEWKKYLYALEKGDIVILIQSTSFRISNHRIRMELNNREIVVIEHIRLAYLKAEEYDTYVQSLTCHKADYGRIAKKLMTQIAKSSRMILYSGKNSQLVYDGPFEDPKSNIGDFETTLGSMYPIGEVFTEPVDIAKVNGEMTIHTIPNSDHKTLVVAPFQAQIKDGCIVSHNGPKEFEEVMELIRTENPDKKVHLREMGFGLNPHISRTNPLFDITAHERSLGFHASLGLKHGIYRKKVAKEINQQFHVDIFADVTKIEFDDIIIFENGRYS